jgi:uncharacterized membrane protein YciS (DUF1049 family)
MLNIYALTFLADVPVAVHERFYLSTLTILFGVGFAAAAVIGSIAWYNSKRPLGWEDKKRPDVVPEVSQDAVSGLDNPGSSLSDS